MDNPPFVYDKAKYHFESVEKAGLPEAHAYHHTAFFFRWLIEKNLMSEFFISECSEPLQALKSGESSVIDIYEWWDCCLISDMLSDQGNAFARSYFDFDHGQYLSDYAKVLQKELPSEFHVEYTEANYQAIKPVIDSRYGQWHNSIKKPWWKFWA